MCSFYGIFSCINLSSLAGLRTSLHPAKETHGSTTPMASEQGKRRDNENAKMESTHSPQDEDDTNEITNVMPQVELIRKSSRIKQPPPVTRNDFLWTN
jgi:hypothetical protein